ncbi:MAG: hypothetical protein H7338_25170 [Candidatus Sericytochromatia bacterium]|nr:hypothetical protein [Candidatus Sericytochromatia bacterium]
MSFTAEDLAPMTTAVIGTDSFTAAQVTALEEGLIELFNDQPFLHKLVHALTSVQHHH